MLVLTDLLWIPLFGLGYWYWVSSQAVKELALAATRTYCAELNLQLLDQTVARHRIWLKRDEMGRLRVWRSFNFEFSSTGNDRYQGQTIMLGSKVTAINLPAHRVH